MLSGTSRPDTMGRTAKLPRRRLPVSHRAAATTKAYRLFTNPLRSESGVMQSYR
jgi:hypothetical protein